MIYCVSRRTDIPAFYWEWFQNRLKEGFLMVRNPYYPEKVSKYLIKPEDVDGFLFLSKNYSRVLQSRVGETSVDDLVKQYRTHWSYTITCYETDLEPNVPSVADSVMLCQELARRVGRERITWRYDPVMLYGKYTIKYHIRAFHDLAELLSPCVASCGINFVTMYDKVYSNIPGLQGVPGEVQRFMMIEFLKIANKFGLKILACKGSGLGALGYQEEACLTLDMLDQTDAWKQHKHQHDCLMCGKVPAKDVGLYNSCLHGCRYCYANQDPIVAFQMWNERKYDPSSPMLLDKLSETDIVSESKQRVFAKEVYHGAAQAEA